MNIVESILKAVAQGCGSILAMALQRCGVYSLHSFRYLKAVVSHSIQGTSIFNKYTYIYVVR